MAQDLKVEVRKETGRGAVKRLRSAGKIPAVIYGQGEESISLALSADDFKRIVNIGDRIVSLSGGVSSDAFVKEVQWDVFGSHVIHVDFARVAAGQLIDTTIKLELRGVAPGIKVGGEVIKAIATLDIKCPPRSMTSKIEVNINELELDQAITIADLPLPEGSEVELPGDTVVVQCVEKAVEQEEEEEPTAGVGPVEPEVIGEKDGEGGE